MEDRFGPAKVLRDPAGGEQEAWGLDVECEKNSTLPKGAGSFSGEGNAGCYDLHDPPYPSMNFKIFPEWGETTGNLRKPCGYRGDALKGRQEPSVPAPRPHQMAGRCSGGRTMAEPSPQPNASKNSGMLARGPSTLNLPGAC